jgi:gamma-glutamylcyclotransferase (GGCT)/AIG2-like uncharacterized protein YtfP
MPADRRAKPQVRSLGEQLLFTYGTLKKHNPRHHLLDKATFIGTATSYLALDFRDLGPFPAIVEGRHPDAVRVKGELYEVTRDTIAVLDEIEQHPLLYTRVPIEVIDEDGKMRSAITYIIRKNSKVWIDARHPNNPVVKTGNWNKPYYEE